jgi:hypothetical protein
MTQHLIPGNLNILVLFDKQHEILTLMNTGIAVFLKVTPFGMAGSCEHCSRTNFFVRKLEEVCCS